ncbi:VOC family protein [Oricola sp.]|uniref:bleomycin resistance protein n=1 Tax=Oricola sp. TaxID=1979950 RepID=UPI0025EC8B46|nr:VOC family protein [Oricola sp.]MCI5078008.1 VOC family protein [Oricola sp.]
MEFNALIPEFAVADIAASLDFYVGLLNFKVEYDRPEEGFAFLSFGRAQLMLDQIGVGRTYETALLERPLGRGCNLQIEVGCLQLDTMLNARASVETPLFLPPEEKWYMVGDVECGQRQFAVMDPDGYLLRFMCDLGSRGAAA